MDNNFEAFSQKYGAFYEDTKNRKSKIRIISNILLILCLVIFFIIAYKNDFDIDVIETCIYICSTILIIIYFQRDIMIRKLDSDYKQTVIQGLLGFIDNTLTYNADSGHTEEEFRKSEQYNGRIDKYYSSDLMEGSIEKTHMKISYVVASQKQKTGKHKMNIPVFAGTLATFDFNKYFNGKTKIYTKDLIAKIGDLLDFMDDKSNDKYEKITLENQEFNEKFIVYTTDVQQAFYILSPALIEDIIKIQSFNNQSRDINISFIENKMYIAFEEEKFLNMDKAENCQQQIEFFYNEIKYMINIVEILELNNRIWTKQ